MTAAWLADIAVIVQTEGKVAYFDSGQGPIFEQFRSSSACERQQRQQEKAESNN